MNTAVQTAWARKLTAGDRRTLARSITKIESTRDDDRAEAEALLDEVLSASGGSVRVGITGTPGVGKSTFIDGLGSRLIEQGKRVAVLAVDPTSNRTGGSILGDKTRMSHLAAKAQAFIRPSPSGGFAGGVGRRTHDAILLCEAAGFDVVIVETMGVGQAEVAVADVTDIFLLLVGPGGGDDLQGIKRGVMELADVVAINKADGSLADAAITTAADYQHAIGLVRSKWPNIRTEVLTCSAKTGQGIDDVWGAVDKLHSSLEESGQLAELRATQAVRQLDREFDHLLTERVDRLPAFAKYRSRLVDEVKAGKRSPSSTAGEMARRAWRELA